MIPSSRLLASSSARTRRDVTALAGLLARRLRGATYWTLVGLFQLEADGPATAAEIAKAAGLHTKSVLPVLSRLRRWEDDSVLLVEDDTSTTWVDRFGAERPIRRYRLNPASRDQLKAHLDNQVNLAARARRRSQRQAASAGGSWQPSW